MRDSTKNYTWAECEIAIGGELQIDITGADWDTTSDMEFIYGKGNEPIDIKEGNEQTTGNITLLQAALERLSDRAPDGKLHKLKGMDIQVAFANDEGVIVRFAFVGVRFTGQPRSIKQGDKKMESAVPFMALRIIRQS